MSHLVGTWNGTIDTARDSTIILREDGKYKQILHLKRTGFTFESEWQPWELKYSADGNAYAHLKGFLMCAYWFAIECGKIPSIEPYEVGDTKDPFGGEFYWYDACQEKWVETPGEAVFRLRVLGLQPRRINLAPYTKSPDSATGPWYELREP